MGSERLTPAERELVTYWMEQIEWGLKYRSKFTDVEDWPTYRAWYRGDYTERQPCEVIVNRVFPYVRSMIPRVYFRTPSISATPRRAEYAMHARVTESVDNWLIYETRVKKQLKKAILDAALCGVGVLKLGYDSEFGYDAMQALDENSSTVTQVGTKSGDAIEYNSCVAPGMPWALRVKPEDIVTPYGYDDPDTFPWVCHMIVRPLDDVMEDQKYDAKYRKQLKGGFTVPFEQRSALVDKRKDSSVTYVLLYEI